MNAILLLQREEARQIMTSKPITNKIFVGAYTHNAANELLNKITMSCPDHLPNILRLGDTNKIWPKKLKQYGFQEKLKKYLEDTEPVGTKERGTECILNSSSVIIGTVYSAASRMMRDYIAKHHGKVFEYLIIDECTQILDSVLNISVNVLDHDKAHLILIGDHKQLPPVIKSDDVQQSSMKTPLFEKLILENQNGDKSDFYTLLNTQYRMPRVLMAFSNSEFYENEIVSHQQSVDLHAVATQNIFDLIDSFDTKIAGRAGIETKTYYSRNIPIFVIRVNNGKATRNNGSWQNEGEGRTVLYLLENLTKYKELSASIGVISFYNEQRKYIDDNAYRFRIKEIMENLLISTVDAFQGKEKDLMILSLVRDVTDRAGNNANSFNCDLKRINVALTRCRKALIVVTSFDIQPIKQRSDKAHFTGNRSVWRRWFKHFYSRLN